MNVRLAAVVWLGVVAFGCEKNKYSIVITPHGDAAERTFTCEKTNPLDRREVGRLAKSYRVPAPPAGGKKYTFTGRFSVKLPGELGGAGWYLHYGTSMGEAFGYSERLWGNDNLAGQISDIQRAADKLVDHLIGWFASELGREPKFGSFREFLNTNLRRDVHNVCLYLWTGAAVLDHKKEAGEEFYIRILQYLAEHGYFDPEQLPEVVKAVNSEDHGLVLVREFVARKLGYDPKGKIPASLGFLADAKKAQASLEKYLTSTPEYQTLSRACEEEKRGTESQGKSPASAPEGSAKNEKSAPKGNLPELSKLDPYAVVMESLNKVLMVGSVHLFPDVDEITVRLACAAKPVATNGEWNKDNHTIDWSKSLDPKDTLRLPMYCYAFWSVPDKKFQQAHFGKIVLDGEDLAGYCVERTGLDEQDGREWDAFLAGLRPGKGLIAQLNAFRFSWEGKGKGKPAATQPARPMENWIVPFCEALKKETSTQPASQPAKK